MEDQRTFLVAAERGKMAALQPLLERGQAFINSCAEQDGSTALHLAAKRGQAPAVLALLRAGADPTATNQAGETPLQLARAVPPGFASSKQEAITLLETGTQLWTLPADPLEPRFLPALKALQAAALALVNKGPSPLRTLLFHSLPPLLRQRLHAIPPPPAPSRSRGGTAPSAAALDHYCAVVGQMTRARTVALLSCPEGEGQQQPALAALQLLLSDTAALTTTLQRGLALEVMAAAGAGSSAAEECIGRVRGQAMHVASELYHVRRHPGLGREDGVLAARLQQQLAGWLRSEAVQPFLRTLCLPLPGRELDGRNTAWAPLLMAACEGCAATQRLLLLGGDSSDLQEQLAGVAEWVLELSSREDMDTEMKAASPVSCLSDLVACLDPAEPALLRKLAGISSGVLDTMVEAGEALFNNWRTMHALGQPPPPGATDTAPPPAAPRST